MHRILQIVKVKQLQSPNAPLNPCLFTLQTDMSWHCSTLHEMQSGNHCLRNWNVTFFPALIHKFRLSCLSVL